MNPVTLPHAWAHEPQTNPLWACRRGDVANAVDAAATTVWSLQRRCALTPRQFGGCFLALAVLSALVALFFWAQGVRFVAYFAGLEVLALALAFGIHAIHAADGERLRLQGDRLIVERRTGLRVQRHEMGLAALRVAEGGDGAIELRVRGQVVPIGRHADAARRRQVLTDLRRLVMRPVAA